MANWNHSYLVEIEDLDIIEKILYLEYTGNGIVILFSFVGCLLSAGRLCESREKQTSLLTFIILSIWLSLLSCAGSSTIAGVFSQVSPGTFFEHHNSCYRVWEVSTVTYTTGHVAFYGVLLHRARASRSLAHGDRVYTLLSKTLLVVTLGAPIVTTIVALVLTQGVLLRDSRGRVYCRPIVLPSASILVAVLDSILSLGYLLLFIIPLRNAIAPMMQPSGDRDTNNDPSHAVAIEGETKPRANSTFAAIAAARQELVQITKRNFILSAIQITGTFVAMLMITVSSFLPMPHVGDSGNTGLKGLNQSVQYCYVAILLDLIIMSAVQYKMTTAWIPRKVLNHKVTRSIHPHMFTTGHRGMSLRGMSSKKVVESSTGGLSEL